MSNQLSGNAFATAQPKDTLIKPDFSDLLETAIAETIKKANETTPHDALLAALLEQVEQIDFMRLAFPQLEKLLQRYEELAADKESWGKANNPKQAEREKIEKDISKMVLTIKHYLVISVEQIIELAKANRWGLCKNLDFIYLYNGAYWQQIEDEIFQKFLGEAAEKQGVEKYNARHYEFRDKLLKQFLSTAYLAAPKTDNDKVLINMQNGTFEVTPHGTRLKPFDRSDFISYQLPFEYDPTATAPMFQKYLDRVLPDKERQRVLAEYLGFVFIKHGSNALKEEKALILYGTGANGKSVFFEVVNALLGDENVGSYSLQSLTEEKGYHRAKLANKLVNYASEINGNLEASIFKQLVSGEPVEARLPYGQPFILKQYAKLIFNCNELPKDVEHTNAYFRRFLIIPFDVTIPESEQDKNLHHKIIDNELAGVFNWVLNGLHRLLEQKRFSECEAAKQAVEAYKLESNSVQMFLNDNDLKPHPTAYKLIKDLYQSYRSYCIEDGMTPFKKSNFIKQLKALGLVVERNMYGNVVFVDAA